MDAPGGTQIAQRAEIGAFRWCLAICHLFSLLIGFLMAAFSRAATRSGTGPRLDLERVREKHGACGMAHMIAKGKATCLVKISPSFGKWHMMVMFTPLRQVEARTHPSKRLKVVDEMRLIEIPAGERQVCPLDGLPFLGPSQRLLKAQ